MERPNVEKMRQEQQKLAQKVLIFGDIKKIGMIGGVDQAIIGDDIISAIVVLDFKTLKVIEKRFAVAKAPVPYMPGFLSYRESPAILEAFSKLDRKPDILMMDCNGILHPRRFGMACHIGVLLDMPTIGVSKNLLCGELKGNTVEMDKEVRGIKIETKQYANPVYVSPGHKISLEKAVEITKQMLKGHKLPEPTHLAHKYVNKVKKMIEKKRSAE